MNPISPLTGKPDTVFERTVPVDFIINAYKNGLHIDVEKYFTGIKSVNLYKCRESGIKFFDPLSIMGDSSFYEQLQKYEWYYMEWKWEYEAALKHLSKADTVLEIGSGRGDFISRLQKDGYSVSGLELNQNTVSQAAVSGLNIIGETVQEHKKGHAEQYDAICSFQVMEHIPQIQEVLTDSVSLLRKKGKLIISVPNDESFIGEDTDNVLNMPPHHCTLWNSGTFEYIASAFHLNLKSLELEPLQTYHSEYYHNVKVKNKGILYKTAYNGLFKPFVFPWMRKFPERIPGHSILAVFEK